MLRIFPHKWKFNMNLMEYLEEFFIMNEKTKVKPEFIFLLFIRVVLYVYHFILVRTIIFLQLSPVVVFHLFIISILPLHALLKHINKSVDDDHKLFWFGLSWIQVQFVGKWFAGAFVLLSGTHVKIQLVCSFLLQCAHLCIYFFIQW